MPIAHEALDMGLDLYFVMEHSWNVTPLEWSQLAGALALLFHSTSPDFAGMGVGFTVYPRSGQFCASLCAGSCSCIDRCGCRESEADMQGFCTCARWGPGCNEADYAPSSPISRATESPNDFYQTLSATVVEPPTVPGDPALYPALLAGLRNRNDWEARHPGRRITQVLVAKSLRFADSCPEDRLSDVTMALSGPDKPKTYVVAVNSGDGDFDSVAAAGRTDRASRITLRRNPPFTEDVIGEFAGIIRKIRDNDGRCEYLVPTPPGTSPDYDKVNLTASSDDFLFKKVANRAACGSHDQGWYYESEGNPDQPRRIVACDGACKILHAQGRQDAGPTTNPDAAPTTNSAKIQLGCPTVLAGDAGP